MAKFCDLGKIKQILSKLFRVYLLYGKIWNQLWQIIKNIGQIWTNVSNQNNEK